MGCCGNGDVVFSDDASYDARNANFQTYNEDLKNVIMCLRALKDFNVQAYEMSHGLAKECITELKYPANI